MKTLLACALILMNVQNCSASEHQNTVEYCNAATGYMWASLVGEHTPSVGRIELALSHGADVNDEKRIGITPLHFVCRELKYRPTQPLRRVFEILLKHPEIDVNGKEGEPLYFLKDSDLLKKLFAHPKLDVNKVDRYGERPLNSAVYDEQAAHSHYLEARKKIILLLEHGAVYTKDKKPTRSQQLSSKL